MDIPAGMVQDVIFSNQFWAFGKEFFNLFYDGIKNCFLTNRNKNIETTKKNGTCALACVVVSRWA